MPRPAGLDCDREPLLMRSLFMEFSASYLPLSVCRSCRAWIIIAADNTMTLDGIVTYIFLCTYLFAGFVLYSRFATYVKTLRFQMGYFCFTDFVTVIVVRSWPSPVRVGCKGFY